MFGAQHQQNVFYTTYMAKLAGTPESVLILWGVYVSVWFTDDVVSRTCQCVGNSLGDEASCGPHEQVFKWRRLVKLTMCCWFVY